MVASLTAWALGTPGRHAESAALAMVELARLGVPGNACHEAAACLNRAKMAPTLA